MRNEEAARSALSGRIKLRNGKERTALEIRPKAKEYILQNSKLTPATIRIATCGMG